MPCSERVATALEVTGPGLQRKEIQAMLKLSDRGHRTHRHTIWVTVALLSLTLSAFALRAVADSSFSKPAPGSSCASKGSGCGSDPAGNAYKKAVWQKLYRLTDSIEAAREYYTRRYKKPFMMSRPPRVEERYVRIFIGDKKKTSRVLLVDRRYRVSEAPMKIAASKK